MTSSVLILTDFCAIAEVLAHSSFPGKWALSSLRYDNVQLLSCYNYCKARYHFQENRHCLLEV